MENKKIKKINTDNFYKTDIREQETIINVDYFEKVASIYTSRKSVANRLLKFLNIEPTDVFYTDGQISGLRFNIPFKIKSLLKIIFSRRIIIGNMM